MSPHRIRSSCSFRRTKSPATCAQQEQIDRREADLHAQVAEQENGARSARLWFGERQQELAARETELGRREREIQEREASVARADREQAEAHERAKADQRRQNEAFSSRQRELDERQQAIDRQDTEQAAVSAALARCAAEQKQIDDRLREEAAQFNRHAAAAIDMLSRFLRGEECLRPTSQRRARPRGASQSPITARSPRCSPSWQTGLSGFAHGNGTSKRLKPCWKTARRNWTTPGGNSRPSAARGRSAARPSDDEMAEAQAHAALDLEQQLRTIKARAEQIERRSAAVDQLRAEVLRTQREALELRLATDEVWRQMIGVAPPAALSQSLAQIRGKLAEQYRLERSEIAGEKKELEMLAERVDRERERVQQQKQEIERWAANRQADIEGQAARLAAREQQLDRRQAEWDQLRLDQLNDRQAYEREIRRLLGQLRRDGSETTSHAA